MTTMAESSLDNVTSTTSIYILLDQPQLLSNTQKDTAINILLIIRLITVVISLPLAVCTLTVFSHRSMRSATGTYVIGLTLAQIVLMVGRLAAVINLLGIKDGPQSLPWRHMVLYINYTGIVSRRASQVVTCTVSIERLYAVLRPLHIKTFFLSKYSMLLTLGTYLISALWHLYLVLNFNVVTLTRNSTVVHTYVPSSFFQNYKDLSIGLSMSAKVVQVFVALSLQIMLNVLTVWALRRHNLKTRDMQSTMKSETKVQAERQMTLTILVTTVCSVILTMPLAVANTWDDFEPVSSTSTYYYNMRILFQELSVNLSAVGCGGVDFFCYMRLSSRYRYALHLIFCCEKKSTNKSEKSTDLESVVQVPVTSDTKTREN